MNLHDTTQTEVKKSWPPPRLKTRASDDDPPPNISSYMRLPDCDAGRYPEEATRM